MVEWKPQTFILLVLSFLLMCAVLCDYSEFVRLFSLDFRIACATLLIKVKEKNSINSEPNITFCYSIFVFGVAQLSALFSFSIVFPVIKFRVQVCISITCCAHVMWCYDTDGEVSHRYANPVCKTAKTRTLLYEYRRTHGLYIFT